MKTIKKIINTIRYELLRNSLDTATTYQQRLDIYEKMGKLK